MQKKKGRLIIQCDEMWSFVRSKDNKQWIWLAIDGLTKEIVGVYIGSRDESGASVIMGFFTPCLSAMCFLLYRLLERIQNNFS